MSQSELGGCLVGRQKPVLPLSAIHRSKAEWKRSCVVWLNTPTGKRWRGPPVAVTSGGKLAGLWKILAQAKGAPAECHLSFTLIYHFTGLVLPRFWGDVFVDMGV